MRTNMPLLIFALLTSFVSLNGFAACLGAEPVDAARTFYNKHQDFHFGNPSKVEGAVSERLHNALMAEYMCPKGDLCALETVPWTDAQDGDIGEPVTFTLVSSSKVTAVVLMHYVFVLSPTEQRPRSVKIHLERKSQNSCWVVSDLITPSGQSVVTFIENWHAKYGKRPNE